MVSRTQIDRLTQRLEKLEEVLNLAKHECRMFILLHGETDEDFLGRHPELTVQDLGMMIVLDIGPDPAVAHLDRAELRSTGGGSPEFC
jgi:hypothetical protein